MRKIILLSLLIICAVALYFGFTLLFTWLYQTTVAVSTANTPVPAPTFTPLPSPTPPQISTATPIPSETSTPLPSPTALPTLTPTALPTAEITPTPTSAAALPQAVASQTVNVREGPGTNYPVFGQLPPNIAIEIIGRNAEGTWWQIQAPDGVTGWVAGSVVEATNTAGIPVVQAPPPPQQPTPIPPTPAPQPTVAQYQYTPTGWYGDRNYGLTRFLGNITDADGNAVDGISVEAACDSFSVVSNPSGPVGWPPFFDSSTDPHGFYDITVASKPVPCKWFLTVVQSPDGKSVTARLSEPIEAEITTEQSIIVANWRKNW